MAWSILLRRLVRGKPRARRSGESNSIEMRDLERWRARWHVRWREAGVPGTDSRDSSSTRVRESLEPVAPVAGAWVAGDGSPRTGDMLGPAGFFLWALGPEPSDSSRRCDGYA